MSSLSVPLALFVVVLIATAAATIAAVVVVFFAKGNRDRRERDQTRRIAKLRDVFASDPSAAAAAVLSSVRGRYAVQVSLLVVLDSEPGARAVARTINSDVRDSAEHHLEQQLRSHSPVLRGAALLLLGELQLGTTRALAKFCHDRDADVRQCAVHALGLHADADAADALIEILADRASTDLAPERVLAQLTPRWAAGYLWEFLSHRPAPGRGTDDPRVVGVLRAAAAGGHTCPDPTVLVAWSTYGHQLERVAALRAIRACCAELPAGIAPQLYDEDLVVVAQTAATMAAFPASFADQRHLLDRLTELLSSSDWWIRLYAAKALGATGPIGVAELETASRGLDKYAAERAEEELQALHRGARP